MPDQKSQNRKVTICEDCGDPNNPSFPNAPETPTPPEGEGPPHYSCEQRFESICNGPKTRTCGNALTKGGGCGGFSYQEDANGLLKTLLEGLQNQLHYQEHILSKYMILMKHRQR